MYWLIIAWPPEISLHYHVFQFIGYAVYLKGKKFKKDASRTHHII